VRKPRIGQRVWADGLTGTFTVVRVNTYQGTADLELTIGTKKVETHIPFSDIHPVGDDWRRTGASSESGGSAEQSPEERPGKVFSLPEQIRIVNVDRDREKIGDRGVLRWKPMNLANLYPHPNIEEQQVSICEASCKHISDSGLSSS
jgi:hypothetical protein